MQNFLQELIFNNVFIFILIFTRIGTAISLMPGIGDSFVPPNVRLLFAVALSFILTPVLTPNFASALNVGGLHFVIMIINEAVIGIFIGTVMKIMISALNVAGATSSAQSGLSNSTIFDPTSGTQNSILSAVYSLVGVSLIMVADVHHFLISAAIYSYHMFPVNQGLPDVQSMTETVANAVNLAFTVGVQVALPFVVIITLMHIGMGFLGRLMPQMQIYFVSIPIQIAVTLILLMISLSYSLIYWLDEYESFLTSVFS